MQPSAAPITSGPGSTHRVSAQHNTTPYCAAVSSTDNIGSWQYTPSQRTAQHNTVLCSRQQHRQHRVLAVHTESAHSTTRHRTVQPSAAQTTSGPGGTHRVSVQHNTTPYCAAVSRTDNIGSWQYTPSQRTAQHNTVLCSRQQDRPQHSMAKRTSTAEYIQGDSKKMSPLAFKLRNLQLMRRTTLPDTAFERADNFLPNECIHARFSFQTASSQAASQKSSDFLRVQFQTDLEEREHFVLSPLYRNVAFIVIC